MWVSKNCTGGSPQFAAPQRTVGRKETQSREIPKPHCHISNASGIGKKGTESCRAAGNYYERPSFSGSNWWKLGVTKVKPKVTTKGQKYPSQKARLCWTDPKHEDVGAGSLLGCRGDTFPPAGVLGRAGWAWGDPAHGATILIPQTLVPVSPAELSLQGLQDSDIQCSCRTLQVSRSLSPRMAVAVNWVRLGLSSPHPTDPRDWGHGVPAHPSSPSQASATFLPGFPSHSAHTGTG